MTKEAFFEKRRLLRVTLLLTIFFIVVLSILPAVCQPNYGHIASKVTRVQSGDEAKIVFINDKLELSNQQQPIKSTSQKNDADSFALCKSLPTRTKLPAISHFIDQNPTNESVAIEVAQIYDQWETSSVGEPILEYTLILTPDKQSYEIVPLCWITPIESNGSVIGLIGTDPVNMTFMWSMDYEGIFPPLSLSEAEDIVTSQFGINSTQGDAKFVFFNYMTYWLFTVTLPDDNVCDVLVRVSDKKMRFGDDLLFELNALHTSEEANPFVLSGSYQYCFHDQAYSYQRDQPTNFIGESIELGYPASYTWMKGKVPYFAQGATQWCAVYSLKQSFWWWGTFFSGHYVTEWDIGNYFGIGTGQGLTLPQIDQAFVHFMGHDDTNNLDHSYGSGNIDSVKSWVYTDCPVIVAIRAPGTGSGNANHAVTILGWDDNLGGGSWIIHDTAPFFTGGFDVDYYKDVRVSYSTFDTYWNVWWDWFKSRGAASADPGDWKYPNPSVGISGLSDTTDSQTLTLQISLGNINGQDKGLTEQFWAQGIFLRLSGAELVSASKGGFKEYHAYDEQGNEIPVAGAKIIEFYTDYQLPPASTIYGYVTIKPTVIGQLTVYYRGWITDEDDAVREDWITIDDSRLGQLSYPAGEYRILRDPSDTYNDRDDFLAYPTKSAFCQVTDDDNFPPSFSNPSTDPSGVIYDSYAGYIRLKITTTDPSGIYAVKFYYRFDGSWIGPKSPSGSSGDTYWCDIPRSEWINNVGQVIYWYASAFDNDNDRPNDQSSTTTSTYTGPTIADDDTTGPSIYNVVVSEYEGDGDGTIEDDEKVKISWSLSDPSGIYSTSCSIEGTSYPVQDTYYIIAGPFPAGVYNYGIIATDNDNDRPDDRASSSYTGSFTVTSQIQPDFNVSVDPLSETVTQGDSTSATVNVTSINGYSQTVSLSYSITPVEPTITVSFDPPEVTPPPNGFITSTMDIITSSSTPANEYTITITGTGADGKTHSTDYTLTVSTAPVHDLAVTDIYTDPSTPMVGQETTINVTAKNEGNQPESDVPVKAYVDGSQVGATLYVTLSPGESSTLSFPWTPDTAKTYSVKGEVGVVPGETDTADNSKTISVTVSPMKWWFDFGTSSSPVETGYIQVTPSTVYSASVGYGWNSSTGLNSRDRGSPDNLRRDFVFSSIDQTFMVDLQSGEYLITVILGDQSFPHDQICVYAEGALKATASAKAGDFIQRAFVVSVVDGRLELVFHDDGGSDPNWVVNALLIEEYIARKFDFGTETSPVEAGYVKVTPSTVYSASTGFGWSTASGLYTRDRGSPDSLRRDFVFSSTDNTFNVDLPNGDYLVMVILGDQLFPHDQICIYAEGDLKAIVSVKADEFVQKVFVVTVADGQLDLLFHDDGGSDPNWVVNALLIEEYSVKRFDFGLDTSPVEADYLKVLPSTMYSASTGFGWADTSSLYGRDRGHPDDLRRDLVFSSTDKVFCVDVPNGNYMVITIVGDYSYKHDLIDIYCEDILMINDLTVNAGHFSEVIFLVTVSEGQLNVRLHDDGGPDPNWVINAILVESM